MPADYMLSFFGDFDNRRLSGISCDEAFQEREACPFFNAFEIPFGLLSIYRQSLTELMKCCIDNKMYVYVYVNTLEISA